MLDDTLPDKSLDAPLEQRQDSQDSSSAEVVASEHSEPPPEEKRDSDSPRSKSGSRQITPTKKRRASLKPELPLISVNLEEVAKSDDEKASDVDSVVFDLKEEPESETCFHKAVLLLESVHELETFLSESKNKSSKELAAIRTLELKFTENCEPVSSQLVKRLFNLFRRRNIKTLRIEHILLERTDSSELCLTDLILILCKASLQNIHINRCNVRKVSPDLFRTFGKLRVADFDENLIEELPGGFEEKSGLEKLFLRDNRIRTISCGSNLSCLKNIQVLDLRENPLTSTTEWFRSFILEKRDCKIFLPKTVSKRFFHGKRFCKGASSKSKIELRESLSPNKRPDDLEEFERSRCAKKLREDIVDCSFSTAMYQTGYLDFDEHLVDGFYDGGRDSANGLTTTDTVSAKACIREIILVDRNRDPRLNKLLEDASQLLLDVSDSFTRVKLLALFVSDAMGGRQDFLNASNIASWQARNLFQDSIMQLNDIRFLSGNNTVSLGSISKGVCRHRSILFKYLADHVKPRVEASVVRGFRGTQTHAWNMVRIGSQIFILDCLDTPHVLKPVEQPLTQLNWNDMYFPIFQTYLDGESRFSRVVVNAKIGGMIGQGGNSSVHMCHIELASKEIICAVKVTDVTDYSPDAVARVFQELPLVAHLNNEHLVQCLGYNIARAPDSRLHLRVFMEFIHGLSLRQLIEKTKGPLNVRDTLALSVKIARGIEYLHSKGFIHRDIKSDNIMLSVSTPLGKTEDDPVLKSVRSQYAIKSVKVVDLSNIVWLEADRVSLDIFGTPWWMPPEILSCISSNTGGKAPYTKKSDSFSFGVVLCEMLFGEHPTRHIPEQSLDSFLRSEQAFLRLRSLPPPTSDECSVRRELCWLADACLELNESKRLNMDVVVSRLNDLVERYPNF